MLILKKEDFSVFLSTQHIPSISAKQLRFQVI
jgi:hypothetical protein